MLVEESGSQFLTVQGRILKRSKNQNIWWCCLAEKSNFHDVDGGSSVTRSNVLVPTSVVRLGLPKNLQIRGSRICFAASVEQSTRFAIMKQIHTHVFDRELSQHMTHAFFQTPARMFVDGWKPSTVEFLRTHQQKKTIE